MKSTALASHHYFKYQPAHPYSEADPEFTPEEGADPIETKVLLVHGAGLAAYNYRKLMRDLQEKGYQCFAPDLPGHGDTSKPGSFGYDAKSYMDALEAFIGATMGDTPVDLVVSGFITSQVRRRKLTLA